MKLPSLLLCMILISSCKDKITEEQCYMSITTVRDITDYHALQPDADAVLSLFNLSEHKEAAVSYRYTEITDKLLVPTVDLYLPDAATGERKNRTNEPMYRERTILQFMDTVRKSLTVRTANKDSVTTLNNSECFKTISRELSLLVQKYSEHKILWVFSNLKENSSILSVFNGGIKQQLTHHPEAIEKLFEQTDLIPQNLKGITVVFAYLPTSREDDQEFNAMVQVYKQLLEKHEAKVLIQATNKSVGI